MTIGEVKVFCVGRSEGLFHTGRGSGSRTLPSTKILTEDMMQTPSAPAVKMRVWSLGRAIWVMAPPWRSTRVGWMVAPNWSVGGQGCKARHPEFVALSSTRLPFKTAIG